MIKKVEYYEVIVRFNIAKKAYHEEVTIRYDGEKILSIKEEIKDRMDWTELMPEDLKVEVK